MSERVTQERKTARDCDLCGGPMDGVKRTVNLSTEQSRKLHAAKCQNDRGPAWLELRVWIPGPSNVLRVDDVCASCLAPLLRKLERVIVYGETP